MNSSPTEYQIVLEIAIQAPAERVFDALVVPEQRVAWWGVEGRFQTTHMESDLRPGGAWLMRGTAGEGQPFAIRGEYRIVERPRALEFTWNREGEQQTFVRFDLEERDGATTVRLKHWGFTDEAARGQYQGWPWLLALLQSHVQAGASQSAG